MAEQQQDPSWLDQCLGSLRRARVAVFGDFCLDAYWLIDADQSELSVETGLPVHRLRQQRYSLGGAGNIVANLAALGVGRVQAVGLVGADLFGWQMRQLLQELHADTGGLLCQETDWQTLVYAKPYLDDHELNRLDFGAFGKASDSSMDQLAQALDRAAGEADVVVLNQQLPQGVSTAPMIQRINQVIARHGGCRFIVDSRHRAELYRGAMLKLNAHEASRLLGEPRPLDERIPHQAAQALARRLCQQTRQPVVVTRGENGLLAADDQGLYEVPGIQILQQTDPVGAGDTVVAALAAALGSGSGLPQAARLANLAASVTVRKLRTTGTASPQEIRDVGPEPDYVYLPELADDPRQARYAAQTEIEIVRDLPPRGRIRHAIFDHDGTLSSLREGWERIMEPMMIRAILGPRYQSADETLYHKVVDTVRRFIDKTTGIQTLVQMQGLAELVRQFGCVPEAQILDMHGYKRLYNQALLEMVGQRRGKLQRGELDAGDFQIKNALPLLRRLCQAGIKLYLASGTDAADVLAEAQAMGYAPLFEGRIYGAVGDVHREAKREVLKGIIAAHHLSGPELVTFGDGPVEMRLTRQCGGIAVGVASDEVRRFGLNPVKRSRLIRAGADLIIPDFSQLDRVVDLLGVP